MATRSSSKGYQVGAGPRTSLKSPASVEPFLFGPGQLWSRSNGTVERIAAQCRTDPLLDFMRSDARFVNLLQRHEFPCIRAPEQATE